MELRIRPAKNSDCELLWEWVNDPEVRRASFVTQDVTLEEHTKWFWARMADRNKTIFIAHKHAYDEKIVAHIKRENASSINSFFKAGYILEDTMTEGDVPSVVMTFE
jgi:hypothetical protein